MKLISVNILYKLLLMLVLLCPSMFMEEAFAAEGNDTKTGSSMNSTVIASEGGSKEGTEEEKPSGENDNPSEVDGEYLSKANERKEIIRNLDAGIIEVFRAKDIKTLKDLKKRFTDLGDRKIAYEKIKSALRQRYETYEHEKSKLLKEYYTWILGEIDAQIKEIDKILYLEKQKEGKNILQNFLDSLFK